MKTSLLIVGFSCLCAAATAQVANEYNKFDIGAAYGVKKVLNTPGIDNSAKFIHVNLGYNFTPYTNFIAEYQNGHMGGVINGVDFTNRYQAGLVRGQIQAGAFLTNSESRFASAMKNAYVGAGVGTITFKNGEPLDGSVPKNRVSNNIFVPLRAGYEYKLFIGNAPSIKLDAAYQYSFMYNDGNQGFRSNHYNDTGHQFILGVKIGFLSRSSFQRSIRR
ncbi:MAG: hypothetical protein K0S09_406 [Sphingobacteriaceae bacterium]|jgi:hypothetical protein|nr:hypothetical protein [Sphingobacteriaceae bacterium]